LLAIIGVLAATGVAALYFVALKPPYLKPWEDWEVEVEPPDEIVIKGLVGKVKAKPVWLTCTSGRNVSISLSVTGLSNARVKPRSLFLNKGEKTKVILIVKISKVKTEEGKLRVEYGAKFKEVKVKVVGLSSPKPGEVRERISKAISRVISRAVS